VVECVAAGPPMGMSPMPRMSHPPGQMQSPLNHTISDLNVSQHDIPHFALQNRTLHTLNTSEPFNSGVPTAHLVSTVHSIPLSLIFCTESLVTDISPPLKLTVCCGIKTCTQLPVVFICVSRPHRNA